MHSFDLVSLKPFIKVADITNLPLTDKSADVAVFCLSLMGKNYLDFIK
jgi:ribosomal RNA-processing protein 8